MRSPSTKKLAETYVQREFLIENTYFKKEEVYKYEDEGKGECTDVSYRTGKMWRRNVGEDIMLWNNNTEADEKIK